MKTIQTALLALMFTCTGSWAADLKAEQAQYEKDCRSCHGADGTPSAAIAKVMKVEMRDLRNAAVQALSNDQMRKIIVEGQGKMKPTAGVSAAAADGVIAYVRTLKK